MICADNRGFFAKNLQNANLNANFSENEANLGSANLRANPRMSEANLGANLNNANPSANFNPSAQNPNLGAKNPRASQRELEGNIDFHSLKKAILRQILRKLARQSRHYRIMLFWILKTLWRKN